MAVLEAFLETREFAVDDSVALGYQEFDTKFLSETMSVFEVSTIGLIDTDKG